MELKWSAKASFYKKIKKKLKISFRDTNKAANKNAVCFYQIQKKIKGDVMNTLTKLQKMNFKYLNKNKLVEYFEAFEDKNFINFTIQNRKSKCESYKDRQKNISIIEPFANNIQTVIKEMQKFATLLFVKTKNVKKFKGEEFDKYLLTDFNYTEDLDFLKIELYLAVKRNIRNNRFYVEKKVVINNKEISTKNLENLRKQLEEIFEELMIILDFLNEIEEKYNKN